MARRISGGTRGDTSPKNRDLGSLAYQNVQSVAVDRLVAGYGTQPQRNHIGDAPLAIVGNSDLQTPELAIVDLDQSSGSAVPSISFYHDVGDNNGRTQIAEIRSNDVLGTELRMNDGSLHTAWKANLAGDFTAAGPRFFVDSDENGTDGRIYNVHTGQVDFSANNTWTDMIDVGHSHVIEITWMLGIPLSGSNVNYALGGLCGKSTFYTWYGNSSQEQQIYEHSYPQSSGIQGINFQYNNSGYKIDVRAQYTGTAPRLLYVVRGHGSQKFFDI